jgi:ABC-type branched-subunit amino acid transport system substrate-binding protein
MDVRVGVLHDYPRADGGAAFEWAVRLGMAEVEATGRLPAPVVFVHEPAHDDVAAAFARLVDRGVRAILGPAITDGALAVRPLVDAACVPCINYAGNEEARSAWMFHFQIGSLEEEPPLLVDHCVRQRCARVALVRDGSKVGERMARFFEDAAAGRCEVVARLRVAPDGRDVAPAVEAARDARPDALVYAGLWRAAHGVALATTARGWRVHGVAGSALMYGHADAAWARDWDGWTYVDTFSERNPRFTALARTAAAQGRAAGPGEAGAFDMGRLLAEALARAPEPTRVGLRAGLERTKALASATGHPGTSMGFGNWDRGALKGPYLVLRRWRDGRSIEA